MAKFFALQQIQSRGRVEAMLTAIGASRSRSQKVAQALQSVADNALGTAVIKGGGFCRWAASCKGPFNTVLEARP